MKRTTLVYLLVTVLGVVLKVMGSLDICANLLPAAASDVMGPLGSIVTAFGITGLFGQGMIQSDPVLQQREKERNDERNTAIRCRAQAWAGNVTGYLLVLGSIVSFSLDGPKWITWTLLGIAGFNLLLTGAFTLWLRRKM